MAIEPVSFHGYPFRIWSYLSRWNVVPVVHTLDEVSRVFYLFIYFFYSIMRTKLRLLEDKDVAEMDRIHDLLKLRAMMRSEE